MSTRESIGKALNEPGTVAPIWSLVTVTYNSEKDITERWSSPLPGSVEWIVVDNDSTDMSAAAAARQGATKVLELEENLGFGAANNRGLAIARGKYVAFVNPDVRVDFDSLMRLAEELDAAGGLVAPQLLNEDGTSQPSGRGFPTIWNKIGHRLPSRDGHRRYVVTSGPDETRYICWAMGAAIAGTRETFNELGGWDERFFVYYEDSDLGMRAWAHGHEVRLVGSVSWVHGWARETISPTLTPWLRELSSMTTFYRRHPELLLPLYFVNKRHSSIASKLGKLTKAN